MTHPDTLQIDRAVEPEWGPQQAYAEGRSAYENSMLPNTTSAVRFNELSSSEKAFWVAHAAFRAALQPQAAIENVNALEVVARLLRIHEDRTYARP